MRTRLRYAAPALASHTPSSAWNDTRLVRACLRGQEEAWAALIDKYKNLIYSIPLKYHAPQQDAADIFQSVCFDLFSELHTLRKTESLRSWLISIAIHKSYQWKKKEQRWSEQEPEDAEKEAAEKAGLLPVPAEHTVLEEGEREQIVRDALARSPQRCQELIRLLFFEHPPLPYDQVAKRLGLATGSIGFIRGRCLKRLQKILEEMNFA